MPDEIPFPNLIRRVRAGDEEAASELVRRYEPEIRTQVRVWLLRRYPHLRRAFDSMDIVQSVMRIFFVRTAIGELELDSPECLTGLLVGMARNKLSEQARHHQAQKRDMRRVQSLDTGQTDVAAGDSSASDVLSARELLQQVRARLSEEERQMADLRAEGRDWAAVAARLGGTPEARRKQFARALDHISQELGLVD